MSQGLSRNMSLLLIMAALVASASTAFAAPKWQFVTSGEGVRVYNFPEKGRSVPRFRGVATIDAPALQLLAILGDVQRSCEWNTACKHSILLSRTDDLRMVFHNRLKAPWPVSDRDAILKTNASISADGSVVRATFRAIRYAKRPPASGVVRFPRLIGQYKMTVISPTRTRVVYTIDSDSGGWLPGWMVRYATKNVPIGTLAGLRKQARRTRGQYAAFIAKHTPKKAKRQGVVATPK
ncbi:MAG: hypothetical protein KC502_10320 [Myxococcales bacterium]|nr:hypothetical protein [Myxococcales bacterium]